MTSIRLIKHARGAPGLRYLGLGPALRPSRGIEKLQNLFNQHAFWAKNRSRKELKRLLDGSAVVISLWQGERLVGFGRATSDGIFRAVLWDIVVADDLQGKGLGRKVVEALLSAGPIRQVERIYLMTTNGTEFYEQIGFKTVESQSLLVKEN